MVEKESSKRLPGRPREFDPGEALDRAVEMFWADGFEGVDVSRIAQAVGVTKPSLYRLFGDKSSLFLHALRRYGETVGAAPYDAFASEPDVADAVRALVERAVEVGTPNDGPRGCLVACVAAARMEGAPEIRAAVAQRLAARTRQLEARFEEEVAKGSLPPDPPPWTRSRLVVDLLQGLLLRARAGVSREDLLEDARSYLPLVLR